MWTAGLLPRMLGEGEGIYLVANYDHIPSTCRYKVHIMKLVGTWKNQCGVQHTMIVGHVN